MNAALRMVLAALAAFGIPSAAGQVLNLSHDLVALGIASRNLTPNDPTLDARPLIEAGTQYAAINSIHSITMDTGNYYLLSDRQSNSTLFFNCIPNQTFDLAGSTLFFRGPFVPNGIYLYFCNNYTVKNFKTDYLDAPVHARPVDVRESGRANDRLRDAPRMAGSVVVQQPHRPVRRGRRKRSLAGGVSQRSDRARARPERSCRNRSRETRSTWFRTTRHGRRRPRSRRCKSETRSSSRPAAAARRCSSGRQTA